MTEALVSVVIVSRHRPEDLRRCVRALSYQTHRLFEVVVICDPTTSASLGDIVPLGRVKTAVCVDANISKARNMGIDLSTGEIIAFIDDDAIAEPTWLERLIAPIIDSNVGASGGFVRGRNGISFQWQAEQITPDGLSHAFDVNGTTIPKVDPERAIKTQGTNCAFRRNILVKLGGFDENYHFYLDETDLNIRAARAGVETAIVPDAEVQHGYAASAQRGQDRRPKSLFEIGASQAYFSKKYDRPDKELDAARAVQNSRVDAALAKGLFDKAEANRLMQDLEAGISQGQMREAKKARKWLSPPEFKSFLNDDNVRPHQFIASRWLFRRKAHASARKLAKDGVACTALILSPTGLYHRRYFHSDGYWVQTGGIFGKSTRSDPLWMWYRFSSRIAAEKALLSNTR